MANGVFAHVWSPQDASVYARRKCLIPMLGLMDSLNVATAATILLYEAARQRGWKSSAAADYGLDQFAGGENSLGRG